LGRLKLPFSLYGGGRGLDERHPAALAADIEVAVGQRDRALARGAPLPSDLARLQFHADQHRLVRAVHVVARDDEASVMTLQFLSGVASWTWNRPPAAVILKAVWTDAVPDETRSVPSL
jgi:hypothetical protein